MSGSQAIAVAMSKDTANILVVGAGSRIAHALVPLLGAQRCRVVGRSPAEPATRTEYVQAASYEAIPAAAFDGISTVVNCVGVTKGAQELLELVNVTTAINLASRSKESGASHLIQISSFSVYGGAHAIGAATLPSPSTEYGKSKLAADVALSALGDEHFMVSILRLPLIYSTDAPSKLSRLIHWWAKIGVMPVPTGDVLRAMIGVELTAEVITELVAQPRGGVIFASDPAPFTYSDAARTRKETLRCLRIPRAIARIAERIVPSIGGRLFADSSLAANENFAVSHGLSSRLYHDIAAFEFR